MAFMKDILTHNIPIWEECAATPFGKNVQLPHLCRKCKLESYLLKNSRDI